MASRNAFPYHRMPSPELFKMATKYVQSAVHTVNLLLFSSLDLKGVPQIHVNLLINPSKKIGACLRTRKVSGVRRLPNDQGLISLGAPEDLPSL